MTGFQRAAVSVLAVSLAVGAGGCAKSLHDAPAAAEGDERLWALHRARVEAVSSWRLEGKVSIRRGDRLWRAGLNWLHDQNSDRMKLLGPGGRELVRLSGRSDGAHARDSKGRVYRAETFEELAAELLGAEVPVFGLRYWVVGVPDPGSKIKSMRIDQNGRIEALEQDGWGVRYLSYQTTPSLSLRTIELPSLLVLTRDDLKITVAANRWKLIKFSGNVEREI